MVVLTRNQQNEDNSRKLMQEGSKKLIEQALQKENPAMSMDERDMVANKVMTAPRDSSVMVGNKVIAIDKLQEQVADNILSKSIADSIELINCGTSPEEEYFAWIAKGREIIADMNDGEITLQDLETRNDFIGNSYQREIELMTCIALYENNRCEGSVEKCAFLKQKLLKNRELRSVIQNTTKDKESIKATKEEYEKAVAYRKLLREMKEAELLKAQQAWTWDLEKNLIQSKVDLGVFHGNDIDINTQGLFYSQLVMAGTLQNDGYSRTPCSYSPAEHIAMRRVGTENKTDVIQRLRGLEGRKPVLKEVTDLERQRQLRVFSADRYRNLYSKSENSR